MVFPTIRGAGKGIESHVMNRAEVAARLFPEKACSTPPGTGKKAQTPQSEEKRIVPLGEFMDTAFPPIISLVGDGVITAASLISIVGRAKLGKTWFTTQAALSIAGMVPYFISESLPVNSVGRVLYVNAEVAEPIFQKRLGLILSEAKRRGFDTDTPRRNFFPVTVRGSLRLDRKSGEQQFMKLIDRVKPTLIVLDPIGPLHYWDENKQQDMGKLLNFLLSAVNYSGAAIIVVHHMGKNNEAKDEIHFGRGSSVWGDRVDSNLNLIPYGEQETTVRLKLSFTLRNGPPLSHLIVTRRKDEFLFRAQEQTDDSIAWLEELLKSEGTIEREECWKKYKESGRSGVRAFKEGLTALERQGKLLRKREGFPSKTYLVATVGTF